MFRKLLLPVLLLLFFRRPLICQETEAHPLATASDRTSPVESGVYFTKDPSDLTVCEGEPAVFEVAIHYTELHIPRLQWQVSADDLSWSDVPGQTALRLVFTERALSDYSNVHVRAVLTSGAQQIISGVARLFVDHNMRLVRHPQKQVVTEGGNALFEFGLEKENGMRNLDFQWQVSTYGSGVWENLSGEYRNFLNLPQVKKSQNGNLYRAVIRSLAGCDSLTTEPAQLIVIARPDIRVTPGAKTFCEGGNVTFSIKLNGGSGKERFQWQLKKDSEQAFQDIPGATGIFYMVPKVTPSMTGYEYRAEVTLPGNVRMTTFPAVITIDGAIAFTGQPENRIACPGEEVVFTTTAEFKGKAPLYQWQVSRDGGKSFENLPNAISPDLRLAVNDGTGDGFLYRALISAGSCQAIPSEIARLSVLGELTFTRQPSDVHLQPGQTAAVFSVDFDENGGHYLINWQKSIDGGDNWSNIFRGFEKKLTVAQSEFSRPALYRVRVLNRECGRLFFSNAVRIIADKL